MTSHQVVLCLPLMLALSGNTSAEPSFGKAGQADHISLVSVIANPDRYDGQQIRAIGALRFVFEGKSLCLHQADQDQAINANCFWIEPDLGGLNTDAAGLSALSGQYVRIEGSFRKDNRAHHGAYAGAIVEIWRAQAWKRPSL